MSQGNHAGPDFSAPDLSSSAPDLSGRAPGGAAPPQPAPGASPRQGWSQFDKPITTRKPRVWARIWPVLVLALVSAVGGAGYELFFHGKTPVGPNPLLGACTMLSGSNDEVTMTKVDCAAPYFSWLAKSVQSSDNSTEEYAWVSTDGIGGPRRQFGAFCLTPNLHQGECYVELAESEVNSCRETTWSDAEVDIRVAPGHDKALASLCPSATEAWTFPDPARTCFPGELR